ncbi:MAG TPA: hypothetical protein PKL49_09075 [Steroidobacteraceae bacterium]|nr:hypothetical protein [Steroidobacteraceae bacterium]HNS28473.1 hypothetical protein [Steroidobacteraceae bacterium]
MTSPIAAYRARSPLAREALLALIALIVGVTLLPLAVYYTGVEILGPYSEGGLWRFWGDFFKGLARGGLSWWLIALGPYALLLFARGARGALRWTAR